MLIRRTLIFSLTLMLFTSFGCSKKVSKPVVPTMKSLPLNVVAKVNGKEISKRTFDEKTRQASVPRELVEELIDQELVALAAFEKYGEADNSNREAFAKQLTEEKKAEFKANVKVTDKDIKAFIERTKANQEIYLLQIVVSGKKQAQEVFALLKSGADFKVTAERFSLEKQYELGLVKRGRLAADLEETAFKLKEYELSPVIRTSLGCYIFKRVPFSKEFIERKIREEKEKAAWQNWINKLRSKSNIVINANLFD